MTEFSLLDYIVLLILLTASFGLGWYLGTEKQFRDDQAIMNYFEKLKDEANAAHDRIYQAALDMGLDKARELMRRSQ